VRAAHAEWGLGAPVGLRAGRLQRRQWLGES
jgi:hypothetical protein